MYAIIIIITIIIIIKIYSNVIYQNLQAVFDVARKQKEGNWMIHKRTGACNLDMLSLLS